MCLAIPAKIISKKEDYAKVDFGNAVLREINISLVDAKVGDYVLVHAGYAIQVIDENDALETINLWKQILKIDIST
jgi:hydrogenase expression/formation protein HypC